MSWPLLFNTIKHNIDNLDTSSNSIETLIDIDTKEDGEDYNWHELTIEENDVCYSYITYFSK
jgi:hypothetical protein